MRLMRRLPFPDGRHHRMYQGNRENLLGIHCQAQPMCRRLRRLARLRAKARVPMLRRSPACTGCGDRETPTRPQHPPNAMPKPDADGMRLVIVGWLLVASRLVL
jgi:hypothetical protein